MKRIFHQQKLLRQNAVLLAGLALLAGGGCGDESAPADHARLVIPSPTAAETGESIPPKTFDIAKPDLPLVNSNPGYVGADSCGECHQERLHEFQQTRHFLAAAVPSEDLMPSVFDNQSATIESHLPGVEFSLMHIGGDFFQKVSREHSGILPQEPSKIGLIYGVSGSADEVYFTWKGNAVRELPVGWLHSCSALGVQQFTDPASIGDFSRVTTTRCLECHNTWFEHQNGTANEYRRSSLLIGVTCERCHGPGREHVEFHRHHPQAITSHALVNPGALSRDRLMDVCGQCHSSGVFRKTDLFSFRPGDVLDDHFRQHQNPNFEDDHVANQVKYLKQSQCFQHSDSMSCVTCHSPHHLTSPTEQGYDSCVKCHQPVDCHERSHLPDAVRDDCVNCHMPGYARLAVRFHTKSERYVFPVRPTQHRIAVYPEARDEVLLQWHAGQTGSEHEAESARLKTRLTQHWLSQADHFEQTYRYFAAIGALREAKRWDETDRSTTRLQAVIDRQTRIDRHFSEAMRLQQQRRFQQAIDELTSLLALKPDHAMAMAKIGTFQAVLGQPDAAVRNLTESLKHDPDSSYGDNMLGWLAYLRSDYQAAADHFHRAEEIYPFTAENNYRWGLALIAMKRWSEAVDKLNVALQISPGDASICIRLSEALRHAGQSDEAVKYAHYAAVLTDFCDSAVLSELFEALCTAGQTEDAAATARRALELPEISGTPQLAEWQKRLEQVSGF